MHALPPIALVFVVVFPTAASAQGGSTVGEPIGRFAVDVQGSFASVPQDAASAAALGVVATDLPSHAFGGRIAATWYPLRLGPVTIGLGGAVAAARASRAAVETRFRSAAPQLSFNFGHQGGWSYISGGISGSRLTIAPKGAGDAPRAQTIDYGGGARWFAREHLAFSFDLRFYAISPTLADTGSPPRGRTTMLVLSVGISLK